MHARYTRDFLKDVAKLRPAQRKRLKEALEIFSQDPYNSALYNHALTGEWIGYRSIAFGGDWRAHYKATDDIATFVACGTHARLYK